MTEEIQLGREIWECDVCGDKFLMIRQPGYKYGGRYVTTLELKAHDKKHPHQPNAWLVNNAEG